MNKSLINEQKHIPILDVIQQATNAILDYKQHQQVGSSGISSNDASRSHEQNWSPPPMATLKVNMDAHFHGDGRWGLGWVVRQADGSCLRVASRIIRASTTTEAEARGLEAVLHAIGTFGEQDITIEMDARTIVDSVKKKTYPRFYWGKIVRSCGDVMNRKPNISIRWVRRTGNKVVQSLA
jgi:ribonuclease HI